ncbi:Cloroperoxidase [Xylaria sp. CBS 124048]|nr:Cloroperoxidase [Xylaria sp. CBS 124048]
MNSNGIENIRVEEFHQRYSHQFPRPRPSQDHNLVTMKITPFLFPAVVLGAACPYGTFSPEKPTDTRGVCPMLNALANHGFLPRTGRDISEDILVKGLQDALNLAPDFGKFLFTAGRIANPMPNATTFNIDHINRHDFFEHDGSLSRQDAYFGQWSRFNQTVWDWTLQYYTSDVLDVQIVADARAQRHTRSQLTNPDYRLSELGWEFSIAENAAILSIIGDKTTLTCPKKFVDYLFSKEELPYSIGWKKPMIPIELQDLFITFDAVQNATSFPPPPPPDNTTDVFS